MPSLFGPDERTAQAADTAKESVVAAHLVAERAGAEGLADSANGAYVHGMGVALLVCGVASLVAALLAGAFLPNTPQTARKPPERSTPDTGPDMVTPRTDAGQ
ncbi:hypothetical protein [Streptomyces sp. TRM68367]|uniref:hypothetical protein n=1 Tax=Streptomyces sp. TRM68367 TaxID=2758415 RepID=UPI0037DC8093